MPTFVWSLYNPHSLTDELLVSSVGASASASPGPTYYATSTAAGVCRTRQTWRHRRKRSHYWCGNLNGNKSRSSELYVSKTAVYLVALNSWNSEIVQIRLKVHVHTLDPPASVRCRVLQTNIPAFSVTSRECRNAKLLYKCLISP